MTEQEKVVQIGVPDERERRRRRYELLAAFLLLLLVLGGTWTQLTLYGVDSWMFIALLNICLLYTSCVGMFRTKIWIPYSIFNNYAR